MVKKQKQLKKQLGSRYIFERHLPAAMVDRLLKEPESCSRFLVTASLTVGVVKLEAVLYWVDGKYRPGYDLLVKDAPDSPAWICYDSLQEEVRYAAHNLEREMFSVLDRAVERYGLSYTACRFPQLSSPAPKPKWPIREAGVRPVSDLLKPME